MVLKVGPHDPTPGRNGDTPDDASILTSSFFSFLVLKR